MSNHRTVIALALAEAAWSRPQPCRPRRLRPRPPRPSRTPFPAPAAVLAVLDRANAAQIKAMRAEPIPVSTGGAVREMSSNWVSAVYYVGARAPGPRHQ
ncbi:hypothetical protein ACRAWD_29480 [Caulobacter segnis]